MHKYLKLTTVLRFVPAMKTRGVSKVARSPRGFLTAYVRAGGNHSDLTSSWRAAREAFIARHMAQIIANDEDLYEADGRPTRRHLALVAWAYSPDSTGLSASRRTRA